MPSFRRTLQRKNMMAANYRHIGGGENRLGRHYSRFSGFCPTAFLADQSLASRNLQNGGSNRRSRASGALCVQPEAIGFVLDPAHAAEFTIQTKDATHSLTLGRIDGQRASPRNTITSGTQVENTELIRLARLLPDSGMMIARSPHFTIRNILNRASRQTRNRFTRWAAPAASTA